MDEIEIESCEQEIVIRDNKRPLILGVNVLTIIFIVITGILVYFFTSEFVSKIILWSLFSLIIFIGLGMIFYIEYQKRQAIKRKEQSVRPFPPRKSNQRGWVRSISTLEAQYVQTAPSAPKLSVSSGWALNPRKWSVATTSYVVNTPQPTNGTVV